MAMTKEHKDLLRVNRVRIVQDLIPTEILDYLLQEEILTDHMREDIEIQPTRSRQASKLIDLLPARGDHAFEVFCHALNSTGHEHLAELLVPRRGISVAEQGDGSGQHQQQLRHPIQESGN